jgi:hypothetical protein
VAALVENEQSQKGNYHEDADLPPQLVQQEGERGKSEGNEE